MNFEKEFKKYTKEISNNFDYEISDEELDNIFSDFFDKDNGTINYMLSSKIKDLSYQKEQTKEKEDLDLDN